MKTQVIKWFVLIVSMVCSSGHASTLVETIPTVKKSIVAIAIYNPVSAPRLRLIGTGFVVGQGNVIATNNHVVMKSLDAAVKERYVVLSGSGSEPKVHEIQATSTSPRFDLALLKINETLPALPLAQKNYVPEGSALAFTGFPITDVLGLYPATHVAYLSAVTPIAIPAPTSEAISAQTIRQLRDPFMIYQLDATAYPGNSGSPLYDQASGQVVGIINMVFVKSSREAVLSDPSGISYAIPVKHLHDLLTDLK